MEILEFEQQLYNLEKQITELKNTTSTDDLKIIQQLEYQHSQLLKSIYSKLTPWQIVQIARHSKRPKSLDYINQIFTNTFSLEGDRAGHIDQAVLTMFAQIEGTSVMVIAQERGNDLETRQKHNFGMVTPAGYRKVKRCVELASKWQLPIVTLIDTSGAYPGKTAEELGQAEAIASCMAAFFKAQVPVVSYIIGEGGSGGAIGIGVANIINILEYSICSVASPEAAASILWKDSSKKVDASQSLGLTAQALHAAGFVDFIIKEPVGGAHRYPNQTIEDVKKTILRDLNKLKKQDGWLLARAREEKFLKFGSHLQ